MIKYPIAAIEAMFKIRVEAGYVLVSSPMFNQMTFASEGSPGTVLRVTWGSQNEVRCSGFFGSGILWNKNAGK